ncbi:TOM (translocase of outer membrane) complex component [Dimargaris cristalligena]|nr:TOM (translocase of outer membrane) complex component [Dimargaris cristalligena]
MSHTVPHNAPVPSGLVAPSVGPSAALIEPLPASSNGALDNILAKRDWKFYLLVSLPPLLLTSLGLWYFSSSSSSSKSSKKGKGKRRVRKTTPAGKGAEAASTRATSEEPSAGASSKVNPAAVPEVVASPADLTEAEIAALSDAQRSEYASGLKSKGNKYYGGRVYPKAIEMYTQALRFKKDPVFFANRAACYNELNEHQKTIEDCDAAIDLNNTYVKALIRRAGAHEKLSHYQEALNDYTYACILDDFQNQSVAASAERVVRKFATVEAKERMANRGHRFPSDSFINAYLASYRFDTQPGTGGEPYKRPSNLDTEPKGVQLYWEAQTSLENRQYKKAMEQIEAALEEGCGPWEARALNSRGTFHFLMGNTEAALADLNRSLELDPRYIQSYLKKANVYTERQQVMETIAAIEKASEVTTVDQTEVHYQKGQVFFINNEFSHAMDEFEKAIDSDPTFVFPYIQLAVCQYKNGEVAKSQSTFRQTIERFPEHTDVFNYYAEVLADQQKFDQALAMFDKAIELDPTNAMAVVNKALMTFQWKQDATTAMSLVQDALRRDPQCEVAVATASQICLQLGHFRDALNYLDQAVEMGKSEEEIISAITIRESTKTQVRVLSENPAMLSKMATNFQM